MLSPHKTGTTLGLLMGVLHLTWALMVALGFAQVLINFIFDLHFIQPPYTIIPFDFGRALSLVLFTSSVGYASGWILSLAWNYQHHRK